MQALHLGQTCSEPRKHRRLRVRGGATLMGASPGFAVFEPEVELIPPKTRRKKAKPKTRKR
jgi:hypothetical protein